MHDKHQEDLYEYGSKIRMEKVSRKDFTDEEWNELPPGKQKLILRKEKQRKAEKDILISALFLGPPLFLITMAFIPSEWQWFWQTLLILGIIFAVIWAICWGLLNLAYRIVSGAISNIWKNIKEKTGLDKKIKEKTDKAQKWIVNKLTEHEKKKEAKAKAEAEANAKRPTKIVKKTILVAKPIDPNKKK